MSEIRESGKIIWAIEPFTTDEAVLKTAAWSLKALSRDIHARVKPVYVWPLDAGEMAPPLAALFPILREEGQKKLERILSKVRVPRVEALEILTVSSRSVGEQARELVSRAREEGAELIVVSSHGRKGVKRWLLGSFAETLSLQSEIPLLIVHPNWKHTPDFKKILFPTDFSKASLEAFERILDFAAAHGSSITLFNQVGAIGYPYFPVFDVAFDVQAAFDDAIHDEFVANQATAKRLAERARARGVRLRAVFDRSRKHTVSDSILRRAKSLGGMIALASHSGALSTAFLGSTARQIVRNSLQPVWVIHPSASTRVRDADSARKAARPRHLRSSAFSGKVF